jgi:hypothetical protein
MQSNKGDTMEMQENQFQRRAIVGERHFILVDAGQPDIWALPGSVVTAVDENGVRSFGAARTISTLALQRWAARQNLPFRIEEKFPVVRRGYLEDLAA